MMSTQRFIISTFVFAALCFTKAKAQTVYITDSGKKYHSKDCSLVKKGGKAISLKDAKKAGYEPCKPCKADEIVALEEKKKVDNNKK